MIIQKTTFDPKHICNLINLRKNIVFKRFVHLTSKVCSSHCDIIACQGAFYPVAPSRIKAQSQN